jgi:Holliday junction DNA helicase RuvA
MIARLSGIVDAIERDRAVVDVGGVGYLVRASSRTLGALTGGGAARLLVETIIREDAIELYGFATAEERDWFRLLTTVQGVGAKVALSLLSSLAPAELARANSASVSGRRRGR